MLYDKLYPYQKTAVDFCAQQREAAIFFEQGLGKSWIAAAVVDLVWHVKAEILFVVPKANLTTTWERLFTNELPHIPVTSDWEVWKKQKGILLLGYGMARKKRGKKRVTPGGGKRWTASKLTNRLASRSWDLVVYDESQYLKSRSSAQARTAHRLRGAKRKLILSGTPMDGNEIHLWSQFKFLAPQLFGTRWSDFDEEFLRPTGYMGYKRTMRGDKRKEFALRIKPHIIRALKRDVMPELSLTHTRVDIVLKGVQRRLYDDLDRDMIATQGAHVITGSIVLTQMLRLQQIAGGYVKTEAGVTIRVGGAKLRALKSVLGGQHGPIELPVVIFCRGRAEIHAIRRSCIKWGHNAVEYYGDTKPKARIQIIDDFQSGKYDILICQIRTGGVGIDLYAANTGVMYSTTFSYIDSDQAYCRLDRNGQTRPVRIYHLLAHNTIDEIAYDAIQQKQDVTTQLFRRITTMAKKKTTTRAGKKKTTTKAADPVAAPVAEPEKVPDEAPAVAAETPSDEAPAVEASAGMKYGVNDLAEALEIKPASVRVKLRKNNIAKAGKKYGWDTEEEFDDIIEALTSGDKAATPAAESEEPAAAGAEK